MPRCIASAVLGCGDSPTDTDPDIGALPFDYPEIAGELKNFLLPGEVVQLAAQPVDSGGHPMDDVALTWSSSDQAVLSVSSGGELTAHAVGEASVRVQTGDMAASLEFVVFPGVATLDVLPPSIGLVPDGIAQVQVHSGTRTTRPLDPRRLTLEGGSPSRSRSKTACRIGLQAMSPGTTTATVIREGKSDGIDVTVATVGQNTLDTHLEPARVVGQP